MAPKLSALINKMKHKDVQEYITSTSMEKILRKHFYEAQTFVTHQKHTWIRFYSPKIPEVYLPGS